METIHYVIILSMIVASAFFSGMEIAFVSANRLKIELDRNKGAFAARILTNFTKKPSRFIASMLLGNNIALVIYGIYMAILLEPLIAQYIISNQAVVLLLQTILSTLIILVTAEFLPKSLFRINPNRILNICAIPLWLVYWCMYPITMITIGLSNVILRLFKVDTSESETAFTKVDLDDFVKDVNERMETEDEIDNEIQILQNALDFENVKARDCMIPRTDIIALDVETNIEVIRDMFIETGLSKILIYRDNIDNIIGYIHSFELFKKPKSIKQILLPIAIVPEANPASEILEKLLREKRSIAVVVDEFGGTSGMLTIEDVMEEIFGEIEDEHDVEEKIEKKVDDSTYIFSGRMEVEDINEKYELNLPESENYETIAGFIIQHTENIPEQGETINFEDFKIKVLEMSNNRIDLIQIRILED